MRLIPAPDNSPCLEKKKLANSYSGRSAELGTFSERAECYDPQFFETSPGKLSISPATCSGEGLKLRLRNRQSVSRPHSWHSAKLLESQPNPSMMQISQGTLGSPWHQAYHSSSSASDLSSYEHGYLRRSPDQYSSRGSMESLDHSSSAYHPCNLSPAKSTTCIDQLAHLHSKRDSAYSSFSTNSSIQEYHPTTFCKERSYSMESMFSQGNLQEGIKHADIRYIKTVYDPQRGVSEEYEVNSSVVKNRGRPSSGHVRNSTGPVGRYEQKRVCSESDVVEGPPLPPARSDSYAITRHHERPSSWSSLDQNRHLRTHSKGPAQPTSASCSSNPQLKPMFGEGQLHTVLEKSPECSPSMKPKQTYSHVPQPGQPMLPTGIYPVPSPEPHFAHAPQPLKNNNGRLYPALAKEGSHNTSAAGSTTKGVSSSQSEASTKSSQNIHSSPAIPYLTNQSGRADELREGGPTQYTHYKLHFSFSPEIPTGSSLNTEDERTPMKINQSFNQNDKLPDSKSVTQMQNEIQVYSGQHSNGEMHVSPNNEKARSHSGSGLQNQGSFIKTNSDVSTIVTCMGTHKDNSILHANRDEVLHFQTNADISLKDKHENRHSVHVSNHRNKLDSPSFTKHIEDGDCSVMYVTNHLQAEEPSSPHKNSNNLTRRRSNSGSNQSNNNLPSVKPDGKNKSSVLQKISQIEQREQENRKSQVLSGSLHGQHSGQSSKAANRASVNSIEELKNKFNSQEHIQSVEYRRLSGSHTTDKISGGHQFKRPGSVYSARHGDIQKTPTENQIDKTQINNKQCVLQPLPDGNKATVNSQTMPNKEDHWQSTSLDSLGFNRAYRNSIKDAQSKVLEATSYRRKDLEISPPQYSKPERKIKRPTSAILCGQTSPVSLHAPKERLSVTPTEINAKSQDFSSQEGAAPSNQVTRIGARKRLTAEQKKRSYSEPEKMNEVGASDSESSSLSNQKKGQNSNFLDQTVADRRRMFEKDGKACSTFNLSKPELKQLQQNALADYIERKTGRRPSPQEPSPLKERSQSTYFSGSMMDTQSISSTSSINSLQDYNMSFRSKDPRESLTKPVRVSSTLPPGLTGLFDLVNLEKNREHQENKGRTSSLVHQRPSLDYKSRTEAKIVPSQHQYDVTASKPMECLVTLSEQRCDKAASDQDLHAKSQQPSGLHVRSRSSPVSEKTFQDFIVRKDSVMRNASYSSPSKGLRSFRSKTEDPQEAAPYETASRLHQSHPTGTERERMTSPSNTIPGQSNVSIQKHTRAQSLTYGYGQHSSLPNTRLTALPSPGKISPSKNIQDSPRNRTPDIVTTEDYLYSENKHCRISPGGAKDRSPRELSFHDNSIDYGDDKGNIKSAPPQRPPPPKIKLHSAKDANQLQNNTASGQKAPSGWKNKATWSSSSSEAETPSHHGKISLRISESGLRASPVVGHDDEDDEVFVKDQEIKPFPEMSFVPPSPPPFPPPTLEEALLKESQEKMQSLPVTRYEDKGRMDSNAIARFPSILQSTDKRESAMENGRLTTPVASAPLRDCGLPQPGDSSASQIPQPTASPLGASVNCKSPTLTQDDKSTTVALNKSTFSHVSTTMMSPEDIKSQELAKEIVDKDKSLADILDPEFRMKTTMDLMQGLFMSNPSVLRENSKRGIKDKTLSNSTSSAHIGKYSAENSSTPYSLSASTAELLRKITERPSKAGQEVQADVNEKKAEFILNLTQKLEILRDAKEGVTADMKLNNNLGEQVEALIESLCKPNEFDKYKMFIGDLDKVVNLLLSLSGRLAKVENVLHSLGEDVNAEERNTWNEKKKQLSGQHEDARELKENLDRREKVVTDILRNYLTKEQFQNYQHFVKMKSALLIEQRELDDKIKLGQEQLDCLLESLPKDFMDNKKVTLREEGVSSSGNVKMLPPLTTSL
ncbi:protein Shroom3 isoform X3 [Hyperolius riggenbachi]|uniref:protein Shroom3 isoform X3 n=1 Tax=Hyperolius riggenbachi TaxID=752182 RepID=UPI0035A361A7